MEVWYNLFSASITMAGFIAVFIVFRYQTIDTYVDERKSILRSLLANEINNDRSILVKIQDIGKRPGAEDRDCFSGFHDERVDRFVNDILLHRASRVRTVRIGLRSIIAWIFLSFFCICGPELFGVTPFLKMLVIVSFVILMLVTLYFIRFSLSKMRPEEMPDYLVKDQYRKSFKSRRTILEEESIRSICLKSRYETALRNIRKFIESDNSLIVDVGCGDGIFISKILHEYPKTVGLDISAKCLSFIRQAQETRDVPLIQGDIEHLPLKSNRLASVVCIETLEHLPNIEMGLKEIHRVLSPNGVLLATAPSVRNVRNISIAGARKIRLLSFMIGIIKTLCQIKRGYAKHIWKDDIGYEFPHRIYWMWKIKRTIKECGFEIASISTTPLVISACNNALIRSTERIINVITANQLGELFFICGVKKS